ncbi:MAG: long-chain fatty acid--CoA ligase [Sulfolobaceae archaeon]
MYYNYQLTLDKILKHGARVFPHQEIVYRDKLRYTFREFHNRVLRFASGLRKIGVKEGDVVGVIDWDTYVYMESYYAVPLAGAVLHTVNIRYPPELIIKTMIHAEDKWVIIRDEFVPLIEKAKDYLKDIKGWIIYSESGDIPKTTLSPVYKYDDLINSEIQPLPELKEDSYATIFYTSGTTGDPKGVRFRHRDLVLHTLSTALVASQPPFSISQKDVLMILVPLFHVHSWGYPFLTMLLGGKYVLPGRYDPELFLKLIKNEKVTYSAMVPTILYMILTHPKVNEYAEYLRGWKVVIGGSALPEGLANLARKMGITVVGGYGLSETCPVLTVGYHSSYLWNVDEETRFKEQITAGTPIPLVELRVVDENGNDVPWDGKTIGEVIVRAPWLTKEYYKNPQKTEELWRGDWLHTGDLATIDQFGYIRIVDRAKDAIKSGGEFIPSILLENVISLHPKVGEVAVVGVKHEKWGERPVAFIVPRGEVTEDEIRRFLEDMVNQGKIQKWWIPDRFIFIKEMPRTSTNKIDKKVLRDMVNK